MYVYMQAHSYDPFEITEFKKIAKIVHQEHISLLAIPFKKQQKNHFNSFREK